MEGTEIFHKWHENILEMKQIQFGVTPSDTISLN